MPALLDYVARSLRGWLGLHRARWRAFRRFGIVLPRGAVIVRAENVTIGSRFGISSDCRLFCQDGEKGSSLVIGDDVLLNIGVMINADCGGRIRIGNKVLIGPNVVIRAADHRFSAPDLPILNQGHHAGIIDIGDDVWLGANVVVLPNVRIGQGSVVGAGAVVTRDLPAFSVAVGVPARVVRVRGREDLPLVV